MLSLLLTASFALPEEQCNGADGVCLLQLKDKDMQIAKQGEFLDMNRLQPDEPVEPVRKSFHGGVPGSCSCGS